MQLSTSVLQENLHECLLTDVSRSPRLIIGRTEAVSISPDDDDHVDSVPEVPIVCIKNEMKDDSDFDKDDTNVLEDTSPLSDCSENTKNFESELQNIMCSMKRDDKRKRVSKKVKKAKKLVLSNVKREKSKSEQNEQKILTIDMSYEEMLSERDREATRESFVKSQYKCESCLIGFNYKKSYLAHVANKHSPELGEYTCPVCKTILPSVDSFTAHYKRHLRRVEKEWSAIELQLISNLYITSFPPAASPAWNSVHPSRCGLAANLHECLLTDVSRSPRLIIGRTEAVSITPDDDDHVDSVPEVPIVCIKNEMKDDSDFDKDDTNVLEDTSPLSDCSENTKNFESELQNIMCSMKRDDKRKRVSKKVKKAKKLVLSNVKREKSKSEQNEQKILTIDMSYEEMLSERDREATRESFVKSQYKCESCLIGFNYKKSYLAHVANKHSPELGEYTCPVCKTILPSVDSFTAHYKRHLRRYECGICHKRTLDMKVMQQHYYSTHEISLKEYKCNLCGKISKHRAGLMNHRLAVHEYHNAFPCTICDKQFRWKNSLKRHLEKHEAKVSLKYCLIYYSYFPRFHPRPRGATARTGVKYSLLASARGFALVVC
ncbi:hypothetical protein B5X24_HaOG210743 [Helicoverpa armigera]|uniref:C2H2-type domain-containing protein n=1 Tax=Helicoverpa armigera TaxID=29058 RepID=A0A2W1BHK0_HELAM|nr:hypothetical protein B5X24_HaOG210743 [Helicoverpa armigera]